VSENHSFYHSSSNRERYRFPGPILSSIAWFSFRITEYPYKLGREFINIPPSWYYLPFVFQAIFDLLVFLMCTIKVSLIERAREKLMKKANIEWNIAASASIWSFPSKPNRETVGCCQQKCYWIPEKRYMRPSSFSKPLMLLTHCLPLMFIVHILHPQRFNPNRNCGLPSHCRISPPTYHCFFGRRDFLGVASAITRILWKISQWKQDDLVLSHVDTSNRESQEFSRVNSSLV
jgi:hypothetical protein